MFAAIDWSRPWYDAVRAASVLVMPGGLSMMSHPSSGRPLGLRRDMSGGSDKKGAGVGSGGGQMLGNYPHGYITSGLQAGLVLSNAVTLVEGATAYWQVARPVV